MDFKGTASEGEVWKYLPQDRVQRWAFVNMVMNLKVP
jgi:hypothetical protein